jgi:hypothetical protein
MCNEAEPGSLALGLTRSQSGRVTSVAPRSKAETGPLPVIGYPDTGGRICFVTGHLKYDQYVCMPDAVHLRHPVNAYRVVLYNTLVISTP